MVTTGAAIQILETAAWVVVPKRHFGDVQTSGLLAHPQMSQQNQPQQQEIRLLQQSSQQQQHLLTLQTAMPFHRMTKTLAWTLGARQTVGWEIAPLTYAPVMLRSSSIRVISEGPLLLSTIELLITTFYAPTVCRITIKFYLHSVRD